MRRATGLVTAKRVKAKTNSKVKVKVSKSNATEMRILKRTGIPEMMTTKHQMVTTLRLTATMTKLNLMTRGVLNIIIILILVMKNRCT